MGFADIDGGQREADARGQRAPFGGVPRHGKDALEFQHHAGAGEAEQDRCQAHGPDGIAQENRPEDRRPDGRQIEQQRHPDDGAVDQRIVPERKAQARQDSDDAEPREIATPGPAALIEEGQQHQAGRAVERDIRPIAREAVALEQAQRNPEQAPEGARERDGEGGHGVGL